MKIDFFKYQGLGNDFVLIDLQKTHFIPEKKRVEKICDRHYGIGCDQLLLLKAGEKPLQYMLRIFNADGQEVGQCGNDLRAAAHYIGEHYLEKGTKQFVISTSSKTHEIMLENGNIAVNMQSPIFEPAGIPFNVPQQKKVYEIETSQGVMQVGVVSVGNPHCVLQVERLLNMPVDILGRELSTNPLFPAQTNVEFMQVITPEKIQLRVYERGVGETLACGSGAVASVAVGQLWGLLGDHVEVRYPGGILTVFRKDQNLWLQGEAAHVFTGWIDLHDMH